MHHWFLALGAVSITMVCQAADEPQWLKDARAREGRKVTAVQIQSTDQWFTASLPAKLIGRIEEADGSYTMELDIGSAVSAYCEVVPEGIDLAETLRLAFEHVMAAAENAQGKVESRALERVDAGAFGTTPYLLTSWIYRVRDEGAPKLGAVKLIAFEQPGVGVNCVHVDVGYVNTFESMVRAFAETLRTNGEQAKPYYREVMTWRLHGQTVGVGVVSLEKDADGDIASEADVAILFPSRETVSSVDTLRRDWLRPDHSLINAEHVVTKDGELVVNLKLDMHEGFWEISGIIDGEQLTRALRADLEPQHWVAHALALRQVLASEQFTGAEVRTMVWGGQDMLGLTETVTRVGDRSAEGFKASRVHGEQKMELVLDNAGTTVSAEIEILLVKLKLQRIFTQGSF